MQQICVDYTRKKHQYCALYILPPDLYGLKLDEHENTMQNEEKNTQHQQHKLPKTKRENYTIHWQHAQIESRNWEAHVLTSFGNFLSAPYVLPTLPFYKSLMIVGFFAGAVACAHPILVLFLACCALLMMCIASCSGCCCCCCYYCCFSLLLFVGLLDILLCACRSVFSLVSNSLVFWSLHLIAIQFIFANHLPPPHSSSAHSAISSLASFPFQFL